MLATGMGGIDWAGLPLVCALLGVTDPETLIEDLQVIRLHTATRPGDGPDPSDRN